MKYNILSAALLLLSIIDLSSGRIIQKRGHYNKESGLFNSVKKGRDTTSIAADGHREAIKFFSERADIDVPEDPAPEDPAQGPSSNPGQPESNPAALGDEAPNTESTGTETGQTQNPPPPVYTPPQGIAPDPLSANALLAPKPLGLNDYDTGYWDALSTLPPAMMWDDSQYILWTGFSSTQSAQGPIEQLKTALQQIPGTGELTSSFDTRNWVGFYNTYLTTNPPPWKVGSIFSIKFGEAIANQAKTVHVLYSSSALDNLPENSLFTSAEMPLVTDANSLVPVVYRWDLDTFEDVIGDGSNVQYNTIWEPGQEQMGGTGLSDLTNDPGATDSAAIAGSAAGTPAGTPPTASTGETPGDSDDDAPAPTPTPAAANPGDSDSDSSSGCLTCNGVPNCICN